MSFSRLDVARVAGASRHPRGRWRRAWPAFGQRAGRDPNEGYARRRRGFSASDGGSNPPASTTSKGPTSLRPKRSEAGPFCTKCPRNGPVFAFSARRICPENRPQRSSFIVRFAFKTRQIVLRFSETRFTRSEAGKAVFTGFFCKNRLRFGPTDRLFAREEKWLIWGGAHEKRTAIRNEKAHPQGVG